MIRHVVNYGLFAVFAQIVKVDPFTCRTPLELKSARIPDLTPARPRLHDLPYKLVIIVSAQEVSIFPDHFIQLRVVK
jgi:hypothetical protein